LELFENSQMQLATATHLSKKYVEVELNTNKTYLQNLNILIGALKGLRGKPEFAPRKVEVCSEESPTLLRIPFGEPFLRPFGRLRDRKYRQ